MKLSYSQKQWVGDLCERASDLKESCTDKSFCIAWDIDHFGKFNLTLYKVIDGSLDHLAHDYLPVFHNDGQPNEGCLLALQEIKQYYEDAVQNNEAQKRERIAELAFLAEADKFIKSQKEEA